MRGSRPLGLKRAWVERAKVRNVSAYFFNPKLSAFRAVCLGLERDIRWKSRNGDENEDSQYFDRRIRHSRRKESSPRKIHGYLPLWLPQSFARPARITRRLLQHPPTDEQRRGMKKMLHVFDNPQPGSHRPPHSRHASVSDPLVPFPRSRLCVRFTRTLHYFGRNVLNAHSRTSLTTTTAAAAGCGGRRTFEKTRALPESSAGVR